MASACSSPTASKKTILFRSPRSQANQDTLFRSKSPRVATSNSNLLYHILPSVSSPTGRTRLLKALASPENKQLDSQLSFKHLSNSIVDIRNLSNIKENIESSVIMKSPKNMKPSRPVRLHTTSRQGGLLRSPKVNKIAQLSELVNTTKTEAEPSKDLGIQAETSPKANLAHRRGLSLSNADTLALREEMRKEYVGSPLIQTNEEALYYDTIKNLDVCGRCWTNCKTHYREPFKAVYKGDRSSSYKKDFVPHSPSRKMPTITGDLYEGYHSNHTVSLGTTMRGDFQPWASNYVKHEGPKTTLGPDGSSLVGRSNYTSEFPDYKAPRSPVERSPQPKTTLSEIPFIGASSYRTTFTDSMEPREFVSRFFRKKGRSPYSIGGSFMGETTNSANYKPFKVEALKGEDKKKDDYEQTPVFLNQFKTNYTKDFDNKGEAPCPARVFIDQNPHPRFRHLKA